MRGDVKRNGRPPPVGPNHRDQTPVDYVEVLDGALDGVRVGVITNHSLVEASSARMMAAFDDAVGDLELLGVEITDFEVPHTKHCMRERF